MTCLAGAGLSRELMTEEPIVSRVVGRKTRADRLRAIFYEVWNHDTRRQKKQRTFIAIGHVMLLHCESLIC
jgi:hypothetical protein